MKHLSRFLFAGGIMAASLSAGASTFIGGRSDFRDETIYFAMTTRFYDGDRSNNVYCWDGINNVNDPEWRGDFKGLIEKLDYIKALGFTAIWITPVVENASGLDYHGYHAFNFEKVDPRYESENVNFQTLIDEVHRRGMKIILDIVIQHTGNFGENTLCPMFEKDYTQPLSNIDKSMRLHPDSKLPNNYFSLSADDQYSQRLGLMKNTRGINQDTHNFWHHYAHFNWDDPSRWWGQIAGDCVDLNTENPATTNYLLKCYTHFINMGVDGFRIDTAGHISRLTFNKAFIPQFHEAAQKAAEKRGGTPFFMFGEVCARAEEVIYRNGNYNCSPCFYTWSETKNYDWDYSETSWDNVVVMEGETGDHVNARSVLRQADDYLGQNNMLHSKNALLDGNNYHTPDYSQSSGLNVIDFPMHWRFHNAPNAFGVRSQDDLYNDATWNVVYVDGHDYGPNGWDTKSFGGSLEAWAENLALMFTWRGIPCIFQGTEAYFRKGSLIDKGAIEPLRNTSRAYFGGYITGSVNTDDFGVYSSPSGNLAATLSHPLALNLQRLNLIRAAVPALRKGQYSTDGCSGTMAFKRRYTDSSVDSYCLVTISGNASFTGILNGTYTDVVTGDVKTVTDGKMSVNCSGQGNLRCYVLSTAKTPAPGKIGADTKFIYGSSPAVIPQAEYDGLQEEGDTDTVRDNGGGGGNVEEPENPVAPSMSEGEQAVFFENNTSWSGWLNTYVWNGSTKFAGSWPGASMTYLGNGIWKWTYYGNDVIPSNSGVIFNNGKSQTADLTWVNGGYYNASGYVKTIPGAGNIDDPTPTNPLSYTVFFDNDASWNAVNVYSWDGSTEFCGSWPGASVTSTIEFDGKKYYTFTVNCGQTPPANPMIIFNNGSGTQTADLVMRHRGIYNSNGDTGLTSLSATSADPDIQIYAAHGMLHINSPHPAVISICTISGSVSILNVPRGTSSHILPKGFYIINGRKIVI